MSVRTEGAGDRAPVVLLEQNTDSEARDANIQVRPLAPSRLDATRRRALALADVLAVACSYAVVIAVAALTPGPAVLAALAATLPLWVVMNKLARLYDRDPSLIDKSTLNELPRISHAVLLGTALLYLGAPLAGFDPGRAETFGFFVCLSALMPLLRQAARGIVRRRLPPERALIAGSGWAASLMARKIGAHPEYGVEVVGLIDGPVPDDYSPPSELDRLGGLSDIAEVAHEHRVERLIVAFSAADRSNPLLIAVREAKLLNLKVTMVPRLFEVLGTALEIDQVEGLVTLGMPSSFRPRSSLRLKRALDLSLATAAVVVLSPVLIACALAVKLSSRGPVLYRQQRIGRDGVPFNVLKFRTMIRGADALKSGLQHLNEATEPMFKIAADPRITRVGRILRTTSVDELPQLWNVLRGEMSLVGPRPLVPTEDGAILGRHRSRLDLTPGLTGPWQVNGRTRIPFDEMIELDYLYVADWSLWNDLMLIIRTIPVVALGHGH